MKHRFICPLFIFIIVILFSYNSSAQTIWSENFTDNPCDSLCPAAGYTSSNGTWTITMTTGGYSNQWYVSSAENAHGIDSCSTAREGAGRNTLHVANVPGSPRAATLCPTGDCGAHYDIGKSTNLVVTDTRIETPAIDLSADSALLLSFLYFEGGDANDNFTLDYFDGTSWSQLADPTKTFALCPTGGYWTSYSIALPPSANKNPNVKIGFHWVNNDDASGSGFSITPTSVAINSITITKAPSAPVASFTGGDTAICGGTCVTYTNTGTGGTSWRWAFTGGSISASLLKNPPAVCYTSPGTYTARLITINTLGADTFVKTITVKDCTPKTITTSAISGSKCVCATFQLSFTITGTFNSGNAFTAQLSDGSGSFTSPVTVGSLSGTTAGVIGVTIPCNNSAGAGYKIRIVSSNPAITGSPSTATIIEVPTSSFTIGSDTVCASESTTITFTGSASVNATYNWGFNGGTVISGSSMGPYAVKWTTPGAKAVSLTVLDGDCSSTANTLNVLVNAIPTATFVVNPSTVCVNNDCVLTYTGTGTAPATYNWNFKGGNATPGGTTQGPQSVSWSTAGNYKVSLAVTQNGCTSLRDSQLVVVNVCAGIDNIASSTTLQVYPNPVGNKLSVNSYSLLASTIEITNILGSRIIIQKATSNENTIDVSKLTPGVYFLSVKYSNGGSEVRKFVKESY